MFYSVNIHFNNHHAFIEKKVYDNNAPYKIPDVIVCTKDDNAMEYLSMDYLALYNSSLCEFCNRNRLCLHFKEDSNRKIIGKVYLLNQITKNQICYGETIDAVMNYIETLMEHKNNENNI